MSSTTLQTSSLSECGRAAESSKCSGKRAAVAGSRAAGGRPSSLARTGSKSTNQLWNSARAIASSVAFIRRFNSILSSSAPSTAAMAFCSARGGRLEACDIAQDAERFALRSPVVPRSKHSAETRCRGRWKRRRGKVASGFAASVRCTFSQRDIESVWLLRREYATCPSVLRNASAGHSAVNHVDVGLRLWRISVDSSMTPFECRQAHCSHVVDHRTTGRASVVENAESSNRTVPCRS